MFDLTRKCPICGKEMEYRPNQMWTGMRNETNQHVWICNGTGNEIEQHSVKLQTKATQEYKDWEKHK